MARATLKRVVFAAVAAAVMASPATGVRPAQSGLRLLTQTVFTQDVHAQQEAPGSPRAQSALTILQINDIYSTVPIDGVGGLARVATLKRQLSANGHPVIMALAGDFLSPSVASSVFKGEQMVAALNSAGLDFATLGNHEFDFGRDVLLQRMAESTFQWVVSNVLDTKTGKPIGNAPPYVIRTVGPLRVGFIGLCIRTPLIKNNQAGIRFMDPMAAAARYIPILKQRGANVIVAITHLGFDEDRALVRRFPEIDIVIGGHEHIPLRRPRRSSRRTRAG